LKLIMKEPGNESYTGQFGVIQFENGTSTSDVSPLDAVRIGAVMRVIWENGNAPSMADEFAPEFLKGAPLEIQITPPPAVAPVGAELSAASSLDLDKVDPNPPHTVESLGAIADAEGIKGLRVIGDKFNVHEKSVAALIQGILKAQAATITTPLE
jgi:hypothetical protein